VEEFLDAIQIIFNLTLSSFAKFEVLVVVWDVAASNLVILYQSFGGTHIFNFLI
jgi:hypothetical protein